MILEEVEDAKNENAAEEAGDERGKLQQATIMQMRIIAKEKVGGGVWLGGAVGVGRAGGREQVSVQSLGRERQRYRLLVFDQLA